MTSRVGGLLRLLLLLLLPPLPLLPLIIITITIVTVIRRPRRSRGHQAVRTVCRPPLVPPGRHHFRSKWLVIRWDPLESYRLVPPPGALYRKPFAGIAALPGFLLPLSHRSYCEFNGKQANELRGIVFLELELLARLNNTTFANAKHSVRNTDFCLFLQYLPGEIEI